MPSPGNGRFVRVAAESGDEGSMDNEGLDEFLNTSEAPEAEVQTSAPETPEAETPPIADDAPKGPQRDDKGRFAPKGETEGASPAPEEQAFDGAATIGERRRRQEAEARIAALEAQIAQHQQPAPVKQETDGPPDRWEDPDGYDQWLIGQAETRAEQRAMQAFQYQRIEMSAAAYRSQVPDYDEKIDVFGQMAQTNPALMDQLHRAPNPAEFAYNTAKTHLEISQYGGIDGLINARVAEALKQAPPPPAPIPETLADQQSSRGSSSALTTPTLDQILGR